MNAYKGYESFYVALTNHAPRTKTPRRRSRCALPLLLLSDSVEEESVSKGGPPSRHGPYEACWLKTVKTLTKGLHFAGVLLSLCMALLTQVMSAQ
jgi:hypothetical protein